MKNSLDYPVCLGNYKDELDIFIYPDSGNITLSIGEPGPIPKIDFSELYFQDEKSIKRISFRITGNCNMECPYCFTNFHKMNNKINNKQYIKAIDDFLKQLTAGDEAGIIITGGEATLYKEDIYTIIEYSAEKGKEKNINCKYLIYSNFMLIDREFLDRVSRYNISIAISIDGEQEQHDKNRYNPTGKSSYKLILENLLKAFDYDSINLEVRTVVQPEEDDLVKIINNNLSLGFTRMHLMPVYGFQSIQYKGNIKVWEQALYVYEKLVINGYRIEIEPFFSIYRKIRYPHTFYTAFYPCNAGRNNLCLGDDGNYYLCNHFVGNKSEVLCDTEQGLPEKDYILQYINKFTNDEVCGKCNMFRLCGGACYHKKAIDKAPHDLSECNNWIEILKMTIRSYIRLFNQCPEALEMLCDKTCGNKGLSKEYIKENILSQLKSISERGVE